MGKPSLDYFPRGVFVFYLFFFQKFQFPYHFLPNFSPPGPKPKPTFFQGSFFCIFFGPAQNKKAHQELSRERRGLPGKIEFFSWVLPGGPHFFSCCGVFFFPRK